MLKLVFKNFDGGVISTLGPRSAMDQTSGVKLAEYAERTIGAARDLLELFGADNDHPLNLATLPVRYELVFDARTDSPTRVDKLAQRLIKPDISDAPCAGTPCQGEPTPDTIIYNGKRYIPSGVPISSLAAADGVDPDGFVGYVVRITGDSWSNTTFVHGRVGHIVAHRGNFDLPWRVALNPSDHDTNWYGDTDWGGGPYDFGPNSRTDHKGENLEVLIEVGPATAFAEADGRGAIV